jgi:hypothetical protein
MRGAVMVGEVPHPDSCSTESRSSIGFRSFIRQPFDFDGKWMSEGHLTLRHNQPALFILGEIHYCVPADPPQKNSPPAS